MPRIFDDITYKDTPVKYVGTDNTQFKALSEDASLQRNTADSAVFKALETNNALKVEDRNAPIKKAALDRLKQTLDQIKNNGTSMGAVSIINQATSDWTTDNELQDAIISKKDETTYLADLKKQLDDGEMSKDFYDMAVIKSKEQNVQPLKYNPNTMSSENMFKGYRALPDNKIKAEIYKTFDDRIKEWQATSVITANGKTYKTIKDGAVNKILVDGKTVPESEVYNALKTEFQEHYSDYLQQALELDKFKSTYDKTSNSYKNITLADLPENHDPNQVDKLVTKMTGISASDIEKLEKDKSPLGQAKLIAAKQKRNEYDLSSQEGIDKLWYDTRKDIISEKYVRPAASKASYTLYDNKVYVDEGAKIALEDLAKRQTAAYEQQLKESKIKPLPTGISNMKAVTINDYDKNNQNRISLTNQVATLKAQVAAATEPQEKADLDSKLKIAESNLAHSTNDLTTFIEQISTKDTDESKDLINTYLQENQEALANEINNNANLYPNKLVVKAKQYLMHKNDGHSSTKSAQNMYQKHSLADALSPSSDVNNYQPTTNTDYSFNYDDIKGKPYFKSVMQKAIELTNASSPVILSAIDRAKKANLEGYTYETKIFNFQDPTTDAKGTQGGYDPSVVTNFQNLVSNSSTQMMNGTNSLNDIITNPSLYATFRFNGEAIQASRPDLQKSKFSFEIDENTGKPSIQIKFYDHDGQELFTKADKKNNQAILSFLPGDVVGAKDVYLDVATQLVNSSYPASQEQGHQIRGFVNYGEDLVNFKPNLMKAGDKTRSTLQIGNTAYDFQFEKTAGNQGFTVKNIAPNGQEEDLFLTPTKPVDPKKPNEKIPMMNKVFGSKEEFYTYLDKQAS